MERASDIARGPDPWEPEEPPERRSLGGLRPLRVVCLGGGTGLPVVLRGLRAFTSPRAAHGSLLDLALQVTAIVTVADDGGSSGRLRRELGVPPPGDIRNCLVALSGANKPLSQLFQYRFELGSGLRGHTMGNLLLTALIQLRGDFLDAVRVAGSLLGARGRVLPCTLRRVELAAEMADGRRIVGERAIVRARGRVSRVSLVPELPPPAPGVLASVEQADLVVLGPGSLYTSLLPNLLVDGMARALVRSPALKVMVVNMMTQPGETDGCGAAEHVRAVQAHAGEVVDCALVHEGALAPALVRRYAARGASPVEVDLQALKDLGVSVIRSDLAAAGHRIRHDSAKLGAAVVRLAKAAQATHR